jgi:hypothetical protein
MSDTRKTGGQVMSWFWCLEHSQAEENMGCGGQKRLGPYATAEQAVNALKRINSREAPPMEASQAAAGRPKSARS